MSRRTDKFLRRQALANGREWVVVAGCSGGFYPRGDLSSGCVFHLRLQLQERGILFAGTLFVYLEALRLEVNG